MRIDGEGRGSGLVLGVLLACGRGGYRTVVGADVCFHFEIRVSSILYVFHSDCSKWASTRLLV